AGTGEVGSESFESYRRTGLAADATAGHPRCGRLCSSLSSAYFAFEEFRRTLPDVLVEGAADELGLRHSRAALEFGERRDLLHPQAMGCHAHQPSVSKF